MGFLSKLSRHTHEGSFGVIYNVESGGKKYVLKRNTRHGGSPGFASVRELDALMHVRSTPGNPTYCLRLEKIIHDSGITGDVVWGNGEDFSPHRKSNEYVDDHMHFVFPVGKGDLVELLRTPDFHGFDVRKILYQCANAVLALHENGMIHRDIKPDNFIYFENGDVRLIDFGACIHLTEDTELTVNAVGTRVYRSPEMIFKQNYGNPYDIYSLGCMFYQFLSENHRHFIDRYGRFRSRKNLDTITSLIKTHPFASVRDWRVYINSILPESSELLKERVAKLRRDTLSFLDTVLREDIEWTGPEEILPLLKQMLNIDPSKRPSIQEVVDHPFFRTVRAAYPSPKPKTVFYYFPNPSQRKIIINAADKLDNDSDRLFFHLVEVCFRLTVYEGQIPTRKTMTAITTLLARMLGMLDIESKFRIDPKEELSVLGRIGSLLYQETVYEMRSDLDRDDLITFLLSIKAEDEQMSKDELREELEKY